MSEEARQAEPALPPIPPLWERREAWIALAVLMAIVVVCFLLLDRGKVSDKVSTAAHVVAVAVVDREDLYNEVTIPAEFRPYVEAELNAKVSGYLDKINVDFGDKVKAGQLLAVLEIPELKDELDSAVAVEQRAEADYTNAHLVYTRMEGVNREHPNLVAQQDIDTAQAKDSVAAAAVSSAKADVEKYQTLFGYTQITAPFDGVITRRYADPGALIQAGTASDIQAKPLVRLSDNYRLRLDFPVSVEYVKDIHLGDSVSVRVDSLGGKSFTGKITRFTDRVNEDTRTMITEIEVANPNLEIVPGMYAAVILKAEHRSQVLAIPTEAVASEKNSVVDVVNQDNAIEEHAVTLGLETPTRYEVTAGLKEGDKVVIGSHSEVHAGEKVEPKPWQETLMH
ncbi:MAG TPA: efflux RND transporter periplasmic adaptor subunit [Verrucomicrobiae bacterium]|jgi:RND family efflux transporter MFP subunit|nr:efflux RND transporter periplasmic adaptor subunit [Verrucomicrobiae bacterium]